MATRKQALSVRGSSGMTLVEMLIALAILATVLLMTSSGIIQSLFVNRLAEEATNTQSKMRRITEVVTQELRSAVLGGIANFPIESTDGSISFALLSASGGITVLPRPGNSWGNSNNTLVHATDPAALQEMVGRPAVMINGSGNALIIPQVTGVGGSNDRVNHNGCKISIDYDPSTRLFSAQALSFEYVPADQTLYQHVLDGEGLNTVPFAFGLSDFDIAYEYASASDTIVRSSPWLDSSGQPQPTFSQSGDSYELNRLRVTLTTADDEDEVGREYVAYVELTGLGNTTRPVSNVTVCDELGGGNGGAWGGPGGDDGGSGGDDGGSGGDDGGGSGGDDGGGSGGDDDDDDDDGGWGGGGGGGSCKRPWGC